MSRTTTVLALTLGSAACVAVGFWFGVREGWNLGAMAAMGPRGALSSSLLIALDEGKPEKARVFLESDVDNALLWSRELEQSPMSPLLGPVWGVQAFPRETQYVARAANYRMAHPSPWESPSLDQSGREMMQTIREMAKAHATNR